MDYPRLVGCARYPDDPRTLALAGVLAQGLAADERPLLRRLPDADFTAMMASCFPGIALENGAASAGKSWDLDEYDDLVALLMEHRADDSAAILWLSHAIATASLRSNHLWQDLGLPNRKVLSRLMVENFPSLAALNAGDMKWKKFFYRQLCEKAEVLICKSPNCVVCDDHAICFGPEEGAALVGVAVSRD
ncbi:MAG: nitrogen fixation protein NifQ [Rhodocyclaceae bacterium]|nr:MAG: nitrogen fixation protein NifQ [Rhodocyclaceae bacterium]